MRQDILGISLTGRICGKVDISLLKRRYVHVDSVIYIGKEVPNIFVNENKIYFVQLHPFSVKIYI